MGVQLADADCHFALRKTDTPLDHNFTRFLRNARTATYRGRRGFDAPELHRSFRGPARSQKRFGPSQPCANVLREDLQYEG